MRKRINKKFQGVIESLSEEEDKKENSFEMNDEIETQITKYLEQKKIKHIKKPLLKKLDKWDFSTKWVVC